LLCLFILSQAKGSKAQIDGSRGGKPYASKFSGDVQCLSRKLPHPLVVSLQQRRVPEVGEHQADSVSITRFPGQRQTLLP
jgi:hypothetical protein